MSLTPEQIAQGWRLHDGSDVCPIKDDLAAHEVMFKGGALHAATGDPKQWQWMWVAAYRIIEAHGADAEQWECAECGGSVPSVCSGVSCSRPTPFPADYSELVFDDAGWSQTIIVDGKRPEWLRDDDWCIAGVQWNQFAGVDWGSELSIRVRRRKPKRETVRCSIFLDAPVPKVRAYIDLIDGKPDYSTLKIAEDAL